MERRSKSSKKREREVMEWPTGRGEEKWERQNEVYGTEVSKLMCEMSQMERKSNSFHAGDC